VLHYREVEKQVKQHL